MRISRNLPLALLVALGVLLLPASAASAATSSSFRVVHCGQSIQAAISAAKAGDTIGVEPCVYHENLTIAKNHLTLQSMRGLGSVVLRPGATPTPSDCIQNPSAVPGICVHGEFNPDGSLGPPVVGTRIDGFVVTNFTDFGVVLLNANDTAVTNTEAKNNKSYGISGFVLSGVRFSGNIAHDNGEPGFYIGDSPNAKAVVVGNRAYRNGVGGAEGFGFLFRDSSHGAVRDNSAWDNCAGFVFVDSGEDPAPMSDWVATGNSALHNNAACKGDPSGPPPTSGIGLVLLGTANVSLVGNTTLGNRPTGPSLTSGGIDVLSSKAIGGADPTNNLISQNRAFRNAPVDILWDKSGTGNQFHDNECNTSNPAWICKQS